MATYHGRRGPEGTVVTVGGKPLDPRRDLRSLSDGGFEWGYDGGGPGQLALAILADHFDDDNRALGEFKRFRSGVIAAIKGDEWSLDGTQIDNALMGIVEVPMTLEQLLDKVRRGGS